MGVAMQYSLCNIKKLLRCSIRTSWRCASEHRALFSAVLVLYLLYRSSPGFFTFLLSSSPVIICATLLLGLLLSYGIKDLPQINEDREAPTDISAPKSSCSSRNVHINAYQRFSVLAGKEAITREASFGRANSNKRIDLDESVPLLKGADQQDEKVDAAGGRLERIPSSAPSVETLQKEVHMEEYMKAYAEQESTDAFSSKDKGDEYANLSGDVHQIRVDGKDTTFTDSQSGEVADVSEHKAGGGGAGNKCRWGRAFSVRQRKKLADIQIEAINSAVDNQLDHSLCSPFTRVGSNDYSSGVDPDNAGRYSPDVSMTDTAALVLDENNPLLGADFSCSAPIDNDDSDNHSNISSQHSQTDSDSNDMADNSKASDDGDGKKDAEKEPAFLWTADDEKNAMDLGYSEIERNRRLEILMAKRKSRKHMSFELEESDVGGIADNVSSFRPRALAISAPRRNPFADNLEIPGSAPSILHPRKNPFDFLTEQSNDSDVPARHNQDPREFMPVSNQDMLFKRYESFNFGRPQGHVPRFKPCFVLEEFNFEEGSTSNFQRQFSDRSVSRLSVVSECDTVSSVGDPEHNELIRNYIRGVREPPSLLRQDSDLVYTENECSDGIGFGDNETLNAIVC